MNIDLQEIRKKTLPMSEYIEKLEQPFQEKFLDRKRMYQLDRESLNHLRQTTGKHVIVAFSAAWCKECAANIAVLALISEATGLEVRVFGGIKKDPLSLTRKWRIPPSPPEAETFQIDKLPTIIVFDWKGNEVDRIIENPRQGFTLEQELCEIIKS